MLDRHLKRLGAVLLALYLATPALSDTLYLRNGEQDEGHLEKMSRDRVWFNSLDSLDRFKKSNVLKIQLQRERLFDDVATFDELCDPELKTEIEFPPEAEAFQAAGSVTLLHRRTIDLTTPGIVKDITRRVLHVLQQRGESAGTQNVWYFEDSDSPRIDFALTVTPDGRVLHLSDTALKDESVYARLPDYRRLSRLRFACKEPRPGSTLAIQYTVERKRGGLLDPFYAQERFRAKEPIVRKEVIVLVREGEEDRLAASMAGPDSVEASRSVESGVVRLAWVLRQPQQGIVDEPHMPPLDAFVPTLTLGETASWQAIGAAYADVLAKLPPLPEPLVAKAAELAAAGGVQTIHDYVARSIATVDVPHLSFRLEPYAPADVEQRAVGNELDKHVLYLRVLQAAGVKARLAFVRGRSRGPLDTGVPSLRAFDRSAVYLVDEGVFSIASSALLAYGVLPGPMQGAPALVIGTGEGLRETQRPPLDAETEWTHIDGVLAPNGDLSLSLTYGANGNEQAWWRSMKDLDEQKLRNRLQQIAQYLHPGTTLESYETTDLQDLSIGPQVTLRCTVPGYAFSAGDDLMMFNLPGLHYSAHDVGRPQRDHPLYWNHVARNRVSTRLTIPEGYRVYSLPETQCFDSPTASYNAELKTDNGAVVFEDTYDLKVDAAPREAYGDFKVCKETRARMPLQRIILTRQ